MAWNVVLSVERWGDVEHRRAHGADSVRTRPLGAHGKSFPPFPCAREPFLRTGSPPCARDEDGDEDGDGTSRSGAPTTSSPATASRRAARGSSPRRLFCVYLRSWGGLAVLSGMPGHKPQKSRLTTTGSGEHAVKRRCQDAAFDLSEAVFGRIQSCGTSAGCFLLRLDFLYLRC